MSQGSSWCVVFEPTSNFELIYGCLKAVSPVPNSVVVNAGDFLQRCETLIWLLCNYSLAHFVVLWTLGSNDTIRSTVHRVVAPPDAMTKDGMLPDRYSIPYVSYCYPLFVVSVVDCLQFCGPVCLSTFSLPEFIHGW